MIIKTQEDTLPWKNLDCQPCMKHTCPLHHHNCMNLIKTVDVLDTVKSFN
jgi:heptosyltransferase-2